MAIGTFKVSDSKRLGSPSSGLDLVQLKSDAGYEALTFRTKDAPAVDVIIPVEAEFEPLGATSGGRIEKAQKISISKDGSAYSQGTETSLFWRGESSENNLFYFSHAEPNAFETDTGVSVDGFEYVQMEPSGEGRKETEISLAMGPPVVEYSDGKRTVHPPLASSRIGLVITKHLKDCKGERTHAMTKAYLPEEGELNHVVVYGTLGTLSSLIGKEAATELDEKYAMWGRPGFLETRVFPEKVRAWAQERRVSKPVYMQTSGNEGDAEGIARAVLGRDASSISFRQVAEGIGQKSLAGDLSQYSLPAN